MATSKFNFTAKTLERLTAPIASPGSKGSRPIVYRDAGEKGLVLLLTSGGSKTFYYYGKVNGRPERIKLGKFPDISIERARSLAAAERAKAGSGINTNAERRKVRDETLLGELFKEYMERYSKVHKRSWKHDEREVPKHAGDWFNRRLSDIKRTDVVRRMEQITARNGPIAANHFLQRLRAIYNKAKEWGWEGVNPAEGIRQNKKESRDRFLHPDELPHFYEALIAEENRTAADYIMTALLTGARKMNVLQMRWEQINWERREWRIPETKNGEPLSLPLSSAALNILEKRRNNQRTVQISPWVFPGEADGAKHYADPKKPWKRILARATLSIWQADEDLAALIQDADAALKNAPLAGKQKHRPRKYLSTPECLLDKVRELAQSRNIGLPSGISDVRLHDLRRTQGSYQAANGANSYIIGKALGHKSPQSTAIYARLSIDPVRQAFEQANESILKYAAGKKANQ